MLGLTFYAADHEHGKLLSQKNGKQNSRLGFESIMNQACVFGFDIRICAGVLLVILVDFMYYVHCHQLNIYDKFDSRQKLSSVPCLKVCCKYCGL